MHAGLFSVPSLSLLYKCIVLANLSQSLSPCRLFLLLHYTHPIGLSALYLADNPGLVLTSELTESQVSYAAYHMFHQRYMKPPSSSSSSLDDDDDGDDDDDDDRGTNTDRHERHSLSRQLETLLEQIGGEIGWDWEYYNLWETVRDDELKRLKL